MANIYLGHGEWVPDSEVGREYVRNLLAVNRRAGVDNCQCPDGPQLIDNAVRGVPSRGMVLNIAEEGIAEDMGMIPPTMEAVLNRRKKKGEEDDDEDLDDNEGDIEDNANPWGAGERSNADTFGGNPDGMVPPKVVDSVTRLTKTKNAFPGPDDYRDEENKRRLGLMY